LGGGGENNTTTITTSQCGSRFSEVWGDPDIGNLTSSSIPARREVESKRPTKQDFVKTFYRRRIL